MNWSALLHRLSHTYFSELAMELSSIIVLIIFCLKGKKITPAKYLFIISTTSLAQILVTELDDLVLSHSKYKGIAPTILFAIYLYVEFIYCLLYIKAHIQSKKIKKAIIYSIISVLGCLLSSIIIKMILILFYSFKPNLHISFNYIMVIQDSLIILFSLWFFWELFKQNTQISVLKIKGFIPIAGMLFFFGITTPLFLFFYYLSEYNKSLLRSLYIINDLSYAVLFISFAIGIKVYKEDGAPGNPLL